MKDTGHAGADHQAAADEAEPIPASALRQTLTWRKNAAQVDGLVELAKANRGDLSVEMSEALPLFSGRMLERFPRPAALIKQTARFVTSSPAAGAVPAAVTALAEGVIRMMWLARLKPLAAVAAALILATAGVAVQGRQNPAPEGAQEQAKTARPPTAGTGAPAPAVPDMAANRTLARQALALIDEALAMMHQLARDDRFNIADPSFSVWGHRKLEMLHKAGAGKAEIIAALEKELNSLEKDEAFAKARKESARGTEVEVRDVQFRRLETQIWLNEEKAR